MQAVVNYDNYIKNAGTLIVATIHQYMDPQESLKHKSSFDVYCFPFVLKLIRIFVRLFGQSSNPITCFPVHSFTGWN